MLVEVSTPPSRVDGEKQQDLGLSGLQGTKTFPSRVDPALNFYSAL